MMVVVVVMMKIMINHDGVLMTMFTMIITQDDLMLFVFPGTR